MEPFITIGVSLASLATGGYAMWMREKAQHEANAKKIARYKEENDRLIEQSNRLGVTDSTQIRNLEEEIHRLTEQSGERENKLNHLQAVKSELETQIQELNKQVAELTAALSEATQESPDGNKSNSELVAMLRSRLQQTESTLQTTRAEHRETQTLLQTVRAELEIVRNQLVEAVGGRENRRLELETALETARREQATLLTELSALREARNAQPQDVEGATVSASELNRSQEELARLKAELEQAQRGQALLLAQLNAAKETTENLEKTQEERLQRLQTIADKQIRRLQDELKEVSARIAATGAAASQEDDRFLNFVNTATVGIVALNSDGNIVLWNRMATEIFGFDKEYAQGRHLTALVVGEDRAALKATLENAAKDVATSKSHAVEVLCLCNDRDPLPVEIAVAAGKSSDELYYMATLVDVTERRIAQDIKRAKDAAEEANRAKSQFLANMSHELRTPLNAIIGFSEILHDRTFGDLTPKQDRYVGNILQSGRHLLQLINDILDLSKVEAGRMELEYVAFPVAVAVRNIENMVKVLLSKKNITLETNISSDLPVLIADQSKVKQIMYNLVSNAIKFTPDGGKVTILAEAIEEGQVLRVSVKDTGIGIKPEDQERVFKEFEQVDSSYARTQQGTGLGLSLVKRFTELHGGRVGVFSEGEGKGTTFTFTLPFTPPEGSTIAGKEVKAAPKPAPSTPPAPVATPAPKESVSVATNGGTMPSPEGQGRLVNRPIVLVVEDDQSASELLTHHLQMAGYTVSRTGSCTEALTIARDIKPSVITLDVQLSDGEGWAVLEELKKNDTTREIPVIMVSIIEDRERAFRLGAADCFTKPVLKSHLLESIARSVNANRGNYNGGKVAENGAAGSGTNGKRNGNART